VFAFKELIKSVLCNTFSIHSKRYLSKASENINLIFGKKKTVDHVSNFRCLKEGNNAKFSVSINKCIAFPTMASLILVISFTCCTGKRASGAGYKTAPRLPPTEVEQSSSL
jgi:hypothetical protein